MILIKRLSVLFFLLVPTFIFIFATNQICSARNTSSSSECVPFVDANKHVGTSQCVTGTVTKIEDGRGGTKLLNFCRASEKGDNSKNKSCPFAVVVFPADIKKLGAIHELEGHQIEIKGTIQDYEGRPQIVLRRSSQLMGDAAFRLYPTVPTDYDAERQGHNSSGKYSGPKAAKKTTAKQGEPTSIEDPGEPQ